MQNVCIDQSAFRSDELRRLVEQTDDRFIVSDAALMEMAKSNTDWETTIRKSLRSLSEVPDRVLFVPGNGTHLRTALQSPKPSPLDVLVSEEGTDWLRGLLAEVASGTQGQGFRTLTANIKEANRGAKQQYLNDEDNRSTLVALVETFLQGAYTDAFRKRLRSNDVGEEEYVTIVSKMASLVINDESMSWHSGTTWAHFEARTYLARWLWLRVETVTAWVAKGGIESARPDRLTNSEIDNHYVQIGSYCDRLLCEDRRQMEKDLRLRSALAMGESWNARSKTFAQT
jgi:hypothetical protein